MAENDTDEPLTQTTEQGLQIPVPRREDVMRDLRKLAQPEAPKPQPDGDCD